MEPIVETKTPIGEVIASIWADGTLFERPVSYELELDVPIIMQMASGRVFRLFGDCFREIVASEKDSLLQLHRQTDEDTDSTKKLQLLCGRTIRAIYHLVEEAGIEIAFDEKLTLIGRSGILGEFSIISLMERLQ